MKKNKTLGFLIASSLVICSTSAFSMKAESISNMNNVSYIIGYELGIGFKKQNIFLDSSTIAEGVKAGSDTKITPKITQEKMEKIMNSFQEEMMNKALKKEESEALKNSKTSLKFMKKISKEKNVKKISNGIYYKVLTEGKGKIPTLSDTVKVNYEGTLINGTKFDSSYDRGQPSEFGLQQVIPCWTKSLEKMPVGSTWTVYCSADQAYGKQAPASIGANQALIFKVELLGIEK